MRRMETRSRSTRSIGAFFALQGDGRITYDVLAAQSLSPSATLRRVKRLRNRA